MLVAMSAGVSPGRRLYGTAVLVVGLPALVALMVPARDRLSLVIPALLVLLLVTGAAVLGGRWVALPGAVAGALLLNWFFTPPFGTLVVESPVQIVVLGVYLAVAVAVSATVDVAARRTAEATRARAEAEALEAADRMRTTLLAGVGHDLRTPLAAVKAAVSSLRQGDVTWTDEERDELLATIEDGADRLQRLVSDLLDASRLQAGVVTTFPESVSLDELVGRALLSLPPTSRVQVDLSPTLPHVVVDVGLAERVLANLLENALRYSPPNAPVTIRGSLLDTSDRVLCEVIDRGPGIPADEWDVVFDSFRRLPPADRGDRGDRGPGGLGLGLTVARGFTEAMGGTLEPAPTPNGGLTMRVEWSIAPARPGPGRP